MLEQNNEQNYLFLSATYFFFHKAQIMFAKVQTSLTDSLKYLFFSRTV